jgi:dTDP-4-dehydrorhamnose reductase
MKVLVTGHRGMLGRALLAGLSGHPLTGADLPELDITDAAAVAAHLAMVRPAAVVHCAAFTRVDDCEADEALATRVNGAGAGAVARACAAVGARLIAISTDYVFAGDLDRPYHEDDPPGPRTAYGRSKLAGERAVLAECPGATVLRTAWLYGPGGPSFVHTMLRLGAQAGPPLKVVDDQVGNPTSCAAVVACIADLLMRPLPGLVHGSCAGETSWYGFAREVFALARLPRAVVPCTTAEYPRPAPRPANSRLAKAALAAAGRPPLPHWRDALAAFLREHPGG